MEHFNHSFQSLAWWPNSSECCVPIHKPDYSVAGNFTEGYFCSKISKYPAVSVFWSLFPPLPILENSFPSLRSFFVWFAFSLIWNCFSRSFWEDWGNFLCKAEVVGSYVLPRADGFVVDTTVQSLQGLPSLQALGRYTLSISLNIHHHHC